MSKILFQFSGHKVEKIMCISPAERGQKVEVEYVQTFIAVSLYVGVAHCSCEAISLIIHRVKVHILVNNKLQKKFGHTRLLPLAIFWPFSTGLYSHFI